MGIIYSKAVLIQLMFSDEAYFCSANFFLM